MSRLALLTLILCLNVGCPKSPNNVHYATGPKGTPENMRFSNFSANLLDAGPGDICSTSTQPEFKAVKLVLNGILVPSNEYGGWPDYNSPYTFSTQGGDQLTYPCSQFEVEMQAFNAWGDVIDRGNVDANCKLSINARSEIKRIELRLTSALPLLMGFDFTDPTIKLKNPTYLTTIRCPN